MRMKKTIESLVAAMGSTDASAIEHELTKLEGRRAQLAESLDAATHNAIDASAVRGEMIIDNRDQQTLEEANAKVREAEERRVALDDALRTLDQKIAETTTRFEEAKDKAERDRIAQVLEQEADAVEKASLAVDKAAKQFASAYRQLRCAMSPASCLRTPDRHRLGEDRVAALLAAEALAGAIPDLFIHKPDELGVASALHRGFPLGDDVVRDVTRDQQQLDKSSGAREHAELLIATRLRAKADAIRAGHEPPVLPSAPPEPTHHVTRCPPQHHVLFLQPVRYTDRFGVPVLHDAWAARVPAPVAEAAIKQGLGLEADTDAAREKMTEMQLRRRTSPRMPAVTIDDTIDLGVNLAEEVESSVPPQKASAVSA
jgi:hypothetical protein